MYENFTCFLYNVQEYEQKTIFFCTMYKFFRTFVKCTDICAIRNVRKLCTNISVQCTGNHPKWAQNYVFSVQCTRIPVHLLVHFVMLEMLVHFYYSSNVLKQTTFWCGRFQDSSCNSCNDIEGSVCEPPRDTMRVSRTVFLVAEDTGSRPAHLAICTRVLPWSTLLLPRGTFIRVFRGTLAIERHNCQDDVPRKESHKPLPRGTFEVWGCQGTVWELGLFPRRTRVITRDTP